MTIKLQQTEERAKKDITGKVELEHREEELLQFQIQIDVIQSFQIFTTDVVNFEST